MHAGREKLYRELEERIGRTPIERYTGDVPQGNSIFIKRECDNPWGSHYDRVYVALFKHHEQQGDIRPGQNILETTSGSAGVSFAGIGRELGYSCTVAIPAGGERAREEAIKAEGAQLVFTSPQDYISGFPAFLKEFLPNNKGTYFLNHSMGPRRSNNEVSLRSLATIADEAADQLGAVDYFVPAFGNGSSVLGPGRRFKEIDPHTEIVGWEMFSSATAFEKLYPGVWADAFKLYANTFGRHQMPGTSFPGIDFPHINNSVPFLRAVILVTDNRIDMQYRNMLAQQNIAFIERSPEAEALGIDLYEMAQDLVFEDPFETACHRPEAFDELADLRTYELFKRLPNWQDHEPWAKKQGFGRSTAASLAAALGTAKERDVQGKNILILGYDRPERYDQ